MPIEPSAMAVGGGSFASATVNTEIVMPTATQSPTDATAVFADILGSSLVTADVLPSARPLGISATPLSSEKSLASTVSLGVGAKPTKSQTTLSSSMIAPRDNPASSSAAVLDPTNNLVFLSVALPVSLHAQTIAAEAPASPDLAEEIAQGSQESGQPSVSSTVPSVAVSRSPVFSSANPPTETLTNLFDARPTQAAVGPAQLASAASGSAPVTATDGVQSLQGQAAVASGTASRAISTAGASSEPSFHATTSKNAASQSVITTTDASGFALPIAFARAATPQSRAAAADFPNPTPSESSPLSAALSETSSRSSATPDATQRFALGAAAQPASSAAPLLSSVQNLQESTKESGHSQANSAYEQKAPSRSGNTAAVNAKIADLPNATAAPVLPAAMRVQANSHFSDLATSGAARTNSSSASAILTNGGAVPTHDAAGDPSFVTSTTAFVSTSVEHRTVALSGNQPAQPNETASDNGAANSANSFGAKVPSAVTAYPVPTITQVASPASNPSVPAFQSDQGASSATGRGADVARHRPSTQHFVAGVAPGLISQIVSSTTHSQPAGHVSGSASTKASSEIARTLTSITAAAAVENDDAAETATSSSADGDSIPDTQHIANSGQATLTDSATPSAPASANPAAEIDAQTSTRAARTDIDSTSATSAPLVATIGANDPGATAQTISSIVSPLSNQQPNVSAAPNSMGVKSGTPNDGGADVVLVRNSAENVQLSAALRAWNGGDNAQTRLVQSVSLGGNVHDSELNVALREGALGAVELHARVSGDVVGASIGVERHDAHAAIASELPALHQALHERQLRVGDLSVFQSPIQAGGAAADGRASQHRESASQRPRTAESAGAQSSVLPEISAFSDSSDAGNVFDTNGRLSVRA